MAGVLDQHGSVGGGCINQAQRIEYGDTVYFVKLNTAGQLDMFAAEACGLQELGSSNTLRVPEPVCWGDNGQSAWLVMENLQFGGRGDQAALGKGLAAMHRITRQQFGWTQDNTIGSTPQSNTLTDDWTEFWREQRLRFQLERRCGRHGDEDPAAIREPPGRVRGWRQGFEQREGKEGRIARHQVLEGGIAAKRQVSQAVRQYRRQALGAPVHVREQVAMGPERVRRPVRWRGEIAEHPVDARRRFQALDQARLGLAITQDVALLHAVAGMAQVRLGADDLGSIMLEENVVAAAGARYRMAQGDMERVIRSAGYTPRQRRTLYEPL